MNSKLWSYNIRDENNNFKLQKNKKQRFFLEKIKSKLP